MYQIEVTSSMVCGSRVRVLVRDDKRLVSTHVVEHVGDGSVDEATIHLSPKDFLRACEPILKTLGYDLSRSEEAI